MDKIFLWLARRLPRRLRYPAPIVSGSEASQAQRATTGSWSGTEVPSVLLVELLQRIRK